MSASSVCSNSSCVSPAGKAHHDAADRPHVDGRVVVVLQRDELGSAVPARDDMLRQLALQRFLVGLPDHRVAPLEGAGRGVDLAGQAEIDDFHVAVAVEEDVGRFEIAMNEVRALGVRRGGGEYLHVEQSAEHLVDDAFDVLVAPTRNALTAPQHFG